jgi:AcrR family transcriptional regulator
MDMSEAKPSAAKSGQTRGPDKSLRERVLKAAFAVFRNRGFEGASTLEIATRAKVSKRDLYALFENKQAVLAACIRERAGRMRLALDPAAPIPHSRDAVAATLAEVGASILRGVCHPDVLAIYRLAIAQSDSAPGIARTLDRDGREANHRALGEWLAIAQAQGLVRDGDTAAMAARFITMLWGDLLIRLLLRVREPPTDDEIKARARTAAEAILGPPIAAP